MAEYIEREALIEKLNFHVKPIVDEGQLAAGLCAWMERIIQEIPSVGTVEIRHGEWKKATSREKSYMYNCSVCGKIAYYCGVRCGYIYCPNCGAKMDGGEDNG